jgi:hypothetical protein
MSRTSRSPTFGFGQFFGTPEIRRELPGFSLATISATRPPLEVPDHTHDTAHLVLVVDGQYLTTATPLEPGRAPVVVYNPPGTRHADRFVENAGVFFTLSIADRIWNRCGRKTFPPVLSVSPRDPPSGSCAGCSGETAHGRRDRGPASKRSASRFC